MSKDGYFDFLLDFLEKRKMKERKRKEERTKKKRRKKKRKGETATTKKWIKRGFGES